MEITETATIAATTKKDDKKAALSHIATKNRGALHLIRVVLYMLRRRSARKSKSVHVDAATKGLWRRLVGGMRPLHLQHHQSPPSPIAAEPSTLAVELFQDVFPSPMSPQQPFSPSYSSSDDSMSQYASAKNLQELDRSEGGDEIEDNDGDEMIDARAEEFIARFYQQMKLQRLDSLNRYNQMMERGSR